MKNLKFIPLLGFLFLSFSAVSQTKFEREGVSFTYPDDWTFLAEDMDGKGYTITIEKEGGLVLILWTTIERDSEDMMDIMHLVMQDNFADLQFNMAYDGTFNDMHAVVSEYSAASIEHSGIIYTFQSNGKTFAVIKHGALADAAENEPVFNSIFTSFKSI